MVSSYHSFIKESYTMSKLRHISEFLPTLEQLSQPLNVDKTDAELIQEHGELTKEIELFNEKVEVLESDLGDYKEELEAKKQGIRDLIEYLHDIERFKEEFEEMSKFDLYHLVLKELRAVEVMK
jgi:archaellum component FlaC